MSSSEFRPLLGSDPERGFRPLGGPAGEGTPPAEAPAPPRLEDTEAYRAGVERGRSEARAEQAALSAALAAAATELAAARAELPARWEPALLDVAVGVAGAIVRRELAERPEHWLAMLRDGIRRAVDRERVVVRVPPTLAAHLEGALPDLRATLAEVRELTLQTDATLAETACRVETRFGEVDLDVDVQLEAARRALAGAEG
jgi:flagellar assembly protein FliH